jgi:hypothetical protein
VILASKSRETVNTSIGPIYFLQDSKKHVMSSQSISFCIQHESRILQEECAMEVMGFIFGIIALGTASSALAKIAALEKKFKEKEEFWTKNLNQTNR